MQKSDPACVKKKRKRDFPIFVTFLKGIILPRIAPFFHWFTRKYLILFRLLYTHSRSAHTTRFCIDKLFLCRRSSTFTSLIRFLSEIFRFAERICYSDPASIIHSAACLVSSLFTHTSRFRMYKIYGRPLDFTFSSPINKYHRPYMRSPPALPLLTLPQKSCFTFLKGHTEHAGLSAGAVCGMPIWSPPKFSWDIRIRKLITAVHGSAKNLRTVLDVPVHTARAQLFSSAP